LRDGGVGVFTTQRQVFPVQQTLGALILKHGTPGEYDPNVGENVFLVPEKQDEQPRHWITSLRSQ
jgi:hypothetical protein